MARAPATLEIEAPPEADRLEGFPHPRETARLYGQAAAERTLAQALAGGRMHHGWMLTGRQGIGKATLAYRFARAALAAPEERDAVGISLTVSDDTIAAHQVRALSHPGLFVLRRSWDEKAKRFTTGIAVDEVRRLRSFLGHRAAGDGWRVVIVDEANEMNLNAANALLKSLEEPPPHTVFLLIASAPGRLLPTIRSRCRVLALSPLASHDLRAAAGHALSAANIEAPKADAWQGLEQLADGSVGRLLAVFRAGGLEMNERVVKLIGSLPKPNWRAVHALSDELQPLSADARFSLFYELLLGFLAQLIRIEASGEGSEADRAFAARLMGEGRLASFAALWERIGRDRAETVALNLDRKALVLQTVAGLVEAAHGP